MCGIFGIIGSSTETLEKPLQSIYHRGPDDKGTFLDSNIKLGFRRLSIVDLSYLGHQPMTNTDKTVWIIFNGEIYNFKELRHQLETKYQFNSRSDTEVLIHGYEEWGIDKLLKKINGMFAFCIYDTKSKEAYLARDRIGKKPLYYYPQNKTMTFSSEVKAFFQLKQFRFSLKKDMLQLLMGFPYLPHNENTILKGVYKVPPASYVKVNSTGIYSTHSYWTLLDSKEVSDQFDTSSIHLEKLLSDSVQKRLEADVPVGVLLSGGLDSSLITAIAAKHTSKKIRTITISFPDSVVDESEYAQTVAKHCKTSHMNLTVDHKNIYDEFRQNIDMYDDLSTTDSGLFSSYLLSKKIRDENIKVVLVGEGADEIFAGYSWFQISQLPFRLLPDQLKSLGYYYAIMRQIPGTKSIHYSQYLNKKINETTGSYLKKMQAYEIRYSLPNHYCMKVDKGPMAASIEARAPFMDYRIIEYARQLPDQYLLHSSFFNPKAINEKYILREIGKKYLPESIVNRKKKGGMIPVYDLLTEGLKRDRGLILKNDVLTAYYGKNFLKTLINSNPTTKLFKWQREWILWKCLLFSLWYDHYNSL